MNYKAVFFDFDETLYPMGNESIKVITDRMNEYIRQGSLAIPDSEVKNFSRKPCIKLMERPPMGW
jgi:FMN phosphatase YigB (HAD superfamily)